MCERHVVVVEGFRAWKLSGAELPHWADSSIWSMGLQAERSASAWTAQGDQDDGKLSVYWYRSVELTGKWKNCSVLGQGGLIENDLYNVFLWPSVFTNLKHSYSENVGFLECVGLFLLVCLFFFVCVCVCFKCLDDKVASLIGFSFLMTLECDLSVMLGRKLISSCEHSYFKTEVHITVT